MNTNTEIKTLEAAREAAYPTPDTLHTSVLMLVANAHVAFTKGWKARDAEITELRTALVKQADAALVSPTGDQLRALVRKASTSASDGASPQELVLAGWQSALAQRAGSEAVPVHQYRRKFTDQWNDVPAQMLDFMRSRVDADLYECRTLYTTPPAAPLGLTDAEIEQQVRNCGGRWNGDVWVIEDADLHPMCRSFHSSILAAATQPATDADKRDAELWRAFIGSARIKPQGSAGLESDTDPNGNAYNGYAHMGLEIWTKYDRDFSPKLLAEMDKDTELGRRWLTAYAAASAKEPT